MRSKTEGYTITIHSPMGDVTGSAGPSSSDQSVRALHVLAERVVRWSGDELDRRRPEPAEQREPDTCEMCEERFRRRGNMKRCARCRDLVPSTKWYGWKRAGLSHAQARGAELIREWAEIGGTR